MKKISIVTFHNAHNYGAVLQTYALYTKLKKMGYDVQILDYRHPSIEKQYKVIKFYGKNPIKLLKQLVKIIKGYSKNKKRYDNFEKFLKDKISLSKNTYYNINDICEKSDIYITGSDQVWNPNIVGNISDVYTLNFGEESIKRISYAASIGNSNIDDSQKIEYRKKLEILDYISVREKEAKKILKPIINRDIEVVLDPTLLITKEEWEKEIEKNYKETEKYILAYVVSEDETYRKIANYLSKRTGLKIIHFESEGIYENVLKSAYTEGPLEFINLIKNAEYVITTSFHATVFSIIFSKKFFVIPNKKTGSRVTNLLEKLEIKDRIYYSLNDFQNINYNLETDWKEVNRKLEEERNKSINWLKNAIEG